MTDFSKLAAKDSSSTRKICFLRFFVICSLTETYRSADFNRLRNFVYFSVIGIMGVILIVVGVFLIRWVWRRYSRLIRNTVLVGMLMYAGLQTLGVTPGLFALMFCVAGAIVWWSGAATAEAGTWVRSAISWILRECSNFTELITEQNRQFPGHRSKMGCDFRIRFAMLGSPW
jgi:hypothetical protein